MTQDNIMFLGQILEHMDDVVLEYKALRGLQLFLDRFGQYQGRSEMYFSLC